MTTRVPDSAPTQPSGDVRETALRALIEDIELWADELEGSMPDGAHAGFGAVVQRMRARAEAEQALLAGADSRADRETTIRAVVGEMRALIDAVLTGGSGASIKYLARWSASLEALLTGKEI